MKREILSTVLLMLLIAIISASLPTINYYGIIASSRIASSQQRVPQPMGVNITSPTEGEKVPVGKLTISGKSTDNGTTDCQVYADINDIKPFQNTTATGPVGQNDYSNWTFTYTEKYHLIGEGVNELTAKLSCTDNNINNSTNATTIKSKWYSVNVTGVGEPSSVAQAPEKNETQETEKKAAEEKLPFIQLQEPEAVMATTQPQVLFSDDTKNYEVEREQQQLPKTTVNSNKKGISADAVDLINKQIPLVENYKNTEEKVTTSKTIVSEPVIQTHEEQEDIDKEEEDIDKEEEDIDKEEGGDNQYGQSKGNDDVPFILPF